MPQRRAGGGSLPPGTGSSPSVEVGHASYAWLRWFPSSRTRSCGPWLLPLCCRRSCLRLPLFSPGSHSALRVPTSGSSSTCTSDPLIPYSGHCGWMHTALIRLSLLGVTSFLRAGTPLSSPSISCGALTLDSGGRIHRYSRSVGAHCVRPTALPPRSLCILASLSFKVTSLPRTGPAHHPLACPGAN